MLVVGAGVRSTMQCLPVLLRSVSTDQVVPRIKMQANALAADQMRRSFDELAKLSAGHRKTKRLCIYNAAQLSDWARGKRNDRRSKSKWSSQAGFCSFRIRKKNWKDLQPCPGNRPGHFSTCGSWLPVRGPLPPRANSAASYVQPTLNATVRNDALAQL